MLAPPLLVVAPPNGGASLVAAMLGRHPQAQDLPELDLFVAPTVEGLLELVAIADGTFGHGLLRAVAAVHCGGQTDAGVVAARRWLEKRADWSGAVLLEALARQLAPRLLITADTSVGWRPGQLDRLRLDFPDIRVLHLLNHPRRYCAELASDLQGRLFVPPDFKDYGVDPPMIDPQLAWLRVHHNLQEAFAEFPGTQYRPLRLEDLHVQPEKTLATLAEWLGLSTEAAAIAAMLHPEHGPFSGFGPPMAPNGAEEAFMLAPKFERRLPIRQGLVGVLNWRPDGRSFAPEVRAQALSFGYR